jgi:hypothetical protein
MLGNVDTSVRNRYKFHPNLQEVSSWEGQYYSQTLISLMLKLPSSQNDSKQLRMFRYRYQVFEKKTGLEDTRDAVSDVQLCILLYLNI